MKIRHFILGGGTSLLAITAAYAADPTDTSKSQVAQAGPNQGLEEVTVTATRRTEKLLQVPLAVQSQSALQIQKEGLKYISDLTFTTPGFIPEQGTGYTQIFIRGEGNNVFVGADPSVVTYIDDVPRIYGSLQNSLVDVDRVEVLKGSQGGVWGRNAAGGVVNITTKQPSLDDINGDVKFAYGTFNTGNGSAYLNVPITDNIAWNVALERDWHDPYEKNVAPNPFFTAANFPNGSFFGSPAATAAVFNSQNTFAKGYNNEDFYSGDTKVLIDVTQNLKVQLAADFSRKRDSYGNGWQDQTPADNALYAEGFFGDFGIKYVPTPGQWTNPGKWQVTNADASNADLRDYGGSAKITYSFPGFDLQNLYAYRAQQTLYEQSYGIPYVDTLPIVRVRKDYQYDELRATSTDDGPLHWIAGVTYLQNYFHGNTDIVILPPIYQIVNAPNQWIRNWSAYIDATYDITSKFSVEGSLRFIDEKNDTTFVLPSPGHHAGEETRLIPAGTFSYKLDNGGVAYVRYAEGWKAGGVNVVSPPQLYGNPDGQGVVFKPEIVNTYEVGYKDRFLDNKLQFTGDIFYEDFSNLQVALGGPASTPAIILSYINAGSAKSYGVEANVNYRIIPELTIGIDAGWLEAEYGQFGNSDPTAAAVFNFSNTRMLWSPKWQGGLTLDYDQPLNDQYRLVASWLTSFVGATIGDLSGPPYPNNNENPYIPGYSVTNVRVGLHTIDDKYAFTVYAKNLFDKEYGTFELGPGGSGGKSFVLGDRRIVGAELEYKF